MTVETGASFINQLNETYPRKSDLIKEGDDHLRLIKQVLKQTLPNFDRAITMSGATLNLLNTVLTPTADTLTINTGVKAVANKTYDFAANKLTNVANPTNPQDVVTLNYLTGGAGAKVAWPVGSIYMSVDTRNPSAYMGFGTWVQFASGRCIIGSGTTVDDRGESRVFNLNQTGGNYQHQLSTNEMPSHSHGHNLSGTTSVEGAHNHAIRTGSQRMSIDDVRGNWFRANDQVNYTETAGAHSHVVTIAGGISATGGNASHNITQPYVVVNIWRRTE